MMLDQKLQFSEAQAITATAASTFVYDLLTGESLTTTFTPTPPVKWGNATYFGEDLGIGQGPGTPRIVGSTIAAFTAGGAATLTVQFQGAPVNSTAQASGNISDLVWATYIQTDALAVSLLTANSEAFSFDWPKRKIKEALPRFVRLNYVVATGPMTAGTINAGVSLGPNDAVGTLGQYPSNYVVGQ